MVLQTYESAPQLAINEGSQPALPDEMRWRFVTESHAYMQIPINGKTLEIDIQQPQTMTPQLAVSIATAISDCKDVLTRLVGTEFQDQPHMQPRLHVRLPGSYDNIRRTSFVDSVATHHVELRSIAMTLKFGTSLTRILEDPVDLQSSVKRLLEQW